MFAISGDQFYNERKRKRGYVMAKGPISDKQTQILEYIKDQIMACLPIANVRRGPGRGEGTGFESHMES